MKERLDGFLRWMLMLISVFAIIVIASFITPLAEMDSYLAANPPLKRALIGATGGVSLVGLLLLVGAQLIVRVGDEVTTAEGAPAQAAASSGFTDRASFREVKEAWRVQAWRDSPRWQRLFLMMAGAILMTLGLFSLFIVIGPPFVKLLSAIAVIYALLRSVVAFARA